MSTAEAAIPYEKQSDPHANRTCGAACLSMVYRSFGKEVAQAEIWPVIAKENRFGSLASTTHLMVKDALGRGLSAVAIQARNPLQVLRLCRESGFRAIINHRLNQQSPAGHFTVLVNIDEANVVLHDPLLGPSRRLSHAALLELWQPRFPNSEIVGNILIGIAAKPPAPSTCELCRTPLPSNVDCPNCGKLIGLQPGIVLGCMNNDCVARMWNYLCCPFCDYTWTFSLQGLPAGARASAVGPSPPAASPLSQGAPPVPAAEPAPLSLDRLFVELDKFCNHILSLPAAANHPDIKRYLAAIATGKEELKQARAEALTHLKTHEERLAKLAGEARLRREAHRKKLEELNRPSPPLDGNALGHALLKNLGFKS